MAESNKMKEMPVNKLMVQMGVPMILSMALQAVYNIVDSAFVGNMREGSEAALNALTLVFPVQMLMVAVGIGTGVGTNALLARTLGQGNSKKAAKVAGNSLFLGVIIYVVCLLFGIFGVKAYISSQTVDAEVLEMGVSYLRICCVISFGIIFFSLFEKLLQATGRSLYSTIGQVVGAVVNIILDPIMIYGIGPVPEMGVEGAAYATVIGQVVSGILVVIYFGKFRKMYLEMSMLKPSSECLKAIISLGMASCINQIAMAIVQIVLNNILRYYGGLSVYGSDIPIACVGVISKVNQVFMAICIGISQGCQPIWGFNYGAKKYDRVRLAYRYSVIACTAIATVFFLCFQLFPHQIVSIFGTGSDLYFQFAERYLKIFMFMTFANGIQPMSSGFFTSIGKAKLGIVMSLTRQVLFLMPLIVVFSLIMGIDGVMYAGPIADAAAFVLAIVFARRELGKMRSAEIV